MVAGYRRAGRRRHGTGTDVVTSLAHAPVARIGSAGGYQPDAHELLLTTTGSALITSYAQVPCGLVEGRSSGTWVDWNFYGHQMVTHVATTPRTADAGHSSVDGHQVSVPHFGLPMSIADFHELAGRLRAGGIEFVIEPYLRFARQPGGCSFATRPATRWSSRRSRMSLRCSRSSDR